MRVLLPALIAVIVSGCSAVPEYVHQSDLPSAKFYLTSTNDSADTSVRRVDVFLYKNDSCETYDSGTGIGFQFENAAAHRTEEHLIPAESAVMINAVYMDARWGEGRTCSAMAGFTPQAGHAYQGHLQVTSDGLQCQLAVDDVTASPSTVNLSFPEYVCDNRTSIKTLNGQAVRTSISLKVN